MVRQDFRVGDFVTNTNQFRIRFIASDTNPQSVVEAGVDGIQLLFCGKEDTCPWDLDNSGAVGVTDLLELLAQWGQVGSSADFDGGGVGVTDLLILLANWGPCP